ncbi:hypothetical protein IX327_000386 [Porphyromonas levii]|nr:hypothetical protein [Porphyromonas levii]
MFCFTTIIKLNGLSHDSATVLTTRKGQSIHTLNLKVGYRGMQFIHEEEKGG